MPIVAGPGDPTVDLCQKVADVIPRRAIEGDGLTGGNFDSNTSPTRPQVLRASATYLADVKARLGGTIPVELLDRAGDVAAIGAAAQIELSYFPELGTTVSDALFKRYDLGIKGLLDAAERITGVDLQENGAGFIATPGGDFPFVESGIDERHGPAGAGGFGSFYGEAYLDDGARRYYA
jgi:hypothetical protein